MRRALFFALVLTALTGQAQAGAWAQAPGHGFTMATAGLIQPSGRDPVYSIGAYSESGLVEGLTLVLKSDSETDAAAARRIFRADGGLRFTLPEELTGRVRLALTASVRFQDEEDATGDPALIGEGWGGGLRLDAGLGFSLFERAGFVNAGMTWQSRPMAADEFQFDVAAGLDVGPEFQLHMGYSATETFSIADGAYAKHAAEAGAVWRIDQEYELGLSVSSTVRAWRTPHETTVRVAVTYRFTDEPDEEPVS